MKFKLIGSAIVLFSLFLVMVSCNKSASELGAEKIAGTYYGGMQVRSSGTQIPEYPSNYVINIEPRSNGTIRISCVSNPAVFETYTTPITYANGTVMAESQAFRLHYQKSIAGIDFFNVEHSISYFLTFNFISRFHIYRRFSDAG